MFPGCWIYFFRFPFPPPRTVPFVVVVVMVLVVLVCDDDAKKRCKKTQKQSQSQTNSDFRFHSRFPSMLFPDPYVYPFLHICARCMLCVVSNSIHPYALSHSCPAREFVAKNNITDAMPPKIQRQNLRDMSEGKEWKCQK